MRLEFTKMEGLGNDYIYVDAGRFAIDDPSELAVRLSDRHFGVGADGLVLIGSSVCADFSMRMFNADGSEGKMCGNAARCVAKYVYDKGLTRSLELSLETLSGVKRLFLRLGADGLVESVTVDMGGFEIVQKELTLKACGQVFRGTLVDVGNPHFVVFCHDADSVDLAAVGPAIENHPLFPDRINVEFVSVLPGDSAGKSINDVSCGISSGHLRMRVWERGSGITLACGTGACATAAAALTLGLPGNIPNPDLSGPITPSGSSCDFPSGISYTIVMDGGPLQIFSNHGALLMTGPARTVYSGSIAL